MTKRRTPTGKTGKTEPGSKPRLLIISHSPISRDARIRKQIQLFSDDYEVTVCGLGEEFETEAELLLHPEAESTRSDQLRSSLLHLKQYQLAQKLEANNLAAARLLKGRTFDAVIANDIEPVGLAITLFGREKVHADLHEYYPGLQDQDPAWVALRQPYYKWMLRNQVTRARSVTTVSKSIADRYQEEFGFTAGVVENALLCADLQPGPVGPTIRLVHSGIAAPNRNLESMMRAVVDSANAVTLDLFLTGQGTPYHDELRRFADSTEGQIRINDPVPPDQLVSILNGFDVGIHVLPPTCTNNALALPNKFFDFVQARLGIIVGPTKDMAQRVKEYRIGAVTEDFGTGSVTRVIDSLTPEKVQRWKSNTGVAARELDVTEGLKVWKGAVDSIAGQALSGARGVSAPEVDAVIAVHRADRPIARAVASVLEGNDARIRVIVVAHNIEKSAIASALGPWAEDTRVLLLQYEDGVHSPAGPMNHGFDSASAPYVTLLGSDDTLEPHAIDRWLHYAKREPHGADFVIANRLEPEGVSAASPPVREGRRTDLDGAKDRLAYRAACLGLMSREAFGDLRFPEGVATGEDVLVTSRMWASGRPLAFAFGSPGYKVHADQESRVTTTPRPVREEFSWVDPLFQDWKVSRPSRQYRRSMIVKILRQNIPDAAQLRVRTQWTEPTRRELAGVLETVIAQDPSALGLLSVSDWELIKLLRTGSTDGDIVSGQLDRRAKLRTVGALIPHDLWRLLDPQAPLRYHLAGMSLARTRRTGVGSGQEERDSK